MTNSTEKVEIVFHRDTTGSMYPCTTEVRKKIEWGLTKLFKEMPDIRIGLGANGDYCDDGDTYVTQYIGLSRNIHDICEFIRVTKNTGGGDLPECYELVLREARGFDWSHNAKKIFVLFADDVPHSPHDPQNVRYNGKGLDWRKEADALAKMGVVVYAVQCLSKGSHATSFYRELAERTGGYHFTLDQFSEVTDLIMAICYKQGDPAKFQEWESEVARSGRMTRSVDTNFAILAGRSISLGFVRKPKSLDAVPPGRFQILDVEGDILDDENKVRISDFVEYNGLIFQKGKGFYEFTKSEIIQEYKEVVLRDKVTGDMFSGEKARQMIGLGAGERARVKPTHLDIFDVFVQSTSYTRKLIGGTRFLYEVDLSR